MTKVQAQYELSRKLSDQDLENLNRVHAVYGIYWAKPTPALDRLLVEFDASHLTITDLQQTLEQHGLPIITMPIITNH